MNNIIICADLHLRDGQPISRTDNYYQTQLEKLEFITETAEKYNAYIFCAGDVFHKAKSSKKLEIDVIHITKKGEWIILPGNHDLPYHNIELLNESSLGIVKASGVGVTISQLNEMKYFNYPYSIGMIHTLIHKGTPIKAGDKIISQDAKKILKQHPDLDLIISGDNHQTFIEELNGRFLVNPGSMMRMTAVQKDHKPHIFLYDGKSLTSIPIPIEQGVIDSSHIEQEEQKELRFKSFIERIQSDDIDSVDFEENIELYFKKNKTRKPVKQLVLEAINE